MPAARWGPVPEQYYRARLAAGSRVFAETLLDMGLAMADGTTTYRASATGRPSIPPRVETSWLVGCIFAREMPTELVYFLALHPEVRLVRGDHIVAAIDPLDEVEIRPDAEDDDHRNDNETYEAVCPAARIGRANWGISQIHAPATWELSTGEGVVVGNIDTGVRYQHQALKRSYRGYSLGVAGRELYVHDYNWFDPGEFQRDPFWCSQVGRSCTSWECCAFGSPFDQVGHVRPRLHARDRPPPRRHPSPRLAPACPTI
ncbi:hypothetical protein H696_04087 [Fonticula alba]|uniref:Subtilisin n=1 Tax=Fonticula alba TaxID=691883 RepID=A0A058Z5W4_FONAL|nr:hypothetical protein H696_04087 [Fonticula alba]KCV69679.1 hypothetical protein H696_04087 [Fonticula alba]|eukprot:XP_009496244.1 hypothetical protein H696_04087 [Fonticula alba]